MIPGVMSQAAAPARTLGKYTVIAQYSAVRAGLRTGAWRLLYSRVVRFSFLCGACCPIIQLVTHRNRKSLALVSIYSWAVRHSFLHGTCCLIMQHVPCGIGIILSAVSMMPHKMQEGPCHSNATFFTLATAFFTGGSRKIMMVTAASEKIYMALYARE